jgi:hypothetical protein
LLWYRSAATQQPCNLLDNSLQPVCNQLQPEGIIPLVAVVAMVAMVAMVAEVVIVVVVIKVV